MDWKEKYLYDIKIKEDMLLKLFFVKILIFSLLLNGILFTVPAFAEVVHLEPVEKNKLELHEKGNIQKKNLVIKDRQVIEDLIMMQKEEEIKDIELLWRATIDNNIVDISVFTRYGKDGVFEALLEFDIKPGWHIFAPYEQEFGSPLIVNWKLPENTKILEETL